LCALESRQWDQQTTGLIRQTTGSCIALCEAEPACTAVLMDVSGGTCYLHSDLSMYNLQYELYTVATTPWSRFSVARVCHAPTPAPTPSVPENIANVACGTTIQDAWPVDSNTYIFNKDCTVNPWLCALESRQWDQQTTGLIRQTTGSCIALCEAEPTCTAVLMDASGGTCYLHSDLSMYNLQYGLYTLAATPWSRFSVARVCH